MDLTKIFEMQLLLDKAIMKEHAKVQIANLREKQIVALLVELGEFANEHAEFKYWKKNRTIDRAKLVEEFVDGIHFLTTFATQLKLKPQIDSLVMSECKTLQLLMTFRAIGALSRKYSKKQLKKCYSLYLGLATQLGISDTEILVAYEAKNRTNFERIKSNY